MQPSRNTHSSLELIVEVADGLAGMGMFAMALFPFAIPALALTALIMLPFLLAPLAGMLIAVPVLLVIRSVTGVISRPRLHLPAGRASAPLMVAGQFGAFNAERTSRDE